jgi:hypothetical protein
MFVTIVLCLICTSVFAQGWEVDRQPMMAPATPPGAPAAYYPPNGIGNGFRESWTHELRPLSPYMENYNDGYYWNPRTNNYQRDVYPNYPAQQYYYYQPQYCQPQYNYYQRPRSCWWN